MTECVCTGDVTQKQLTELFQSDPALCYLGLSDSDMNSLYYNKEYPIADNSKYIGLYHDDEFIGFFKLEMFTEITVCCHVFVKTTLQRKGSTANIWPTIRRYIIDNSKARKVISVVPAPCRHVQKAVLKLGAVLEGTLAKACIWRQEIVDLLFYSIDINREDM